MRRSTPRGQMTRGANSGPAVMLMPPAIRATFMPNPPLKHYPPPKKKSGKGDLYSGVASFLVHFEKTDKPPPRKIGPTPKSIKEKRRKAKSEKHLTKLEPQIELFRKEQRRCGGEYEGMNCYNALFVGRLAYEVTERKLLREMEAFGPVKDIRIIKEKQQNKSDSDGGNADSSSGAGGKSKYAFIEYEHEEDMKRAYRACDGMKLEGREIVVDVERGHTVPSWLPRRLGGGLGGTRVGGRDVNVPRHTGRYDPSKATKPQDAAPPQPPPPDHGGGYGGPPPGPPPQGGYHGYGGGPPPPPRGGGGGMGRGGGDRGGGDRYYGHPPPGGPGGPPPPRDWDRGDRDRGDRGASGEWRRDKRPRSDSPPESRRRSSSSGHHHGGHGGHRSSRSRRY